MLRTVVSKTGTGTVLVPLNPREGHFNLSWNAVVTGTVTYKIEQSLEDSIDPEAPSSQWFDLQPSGSTSMTGNSLKVAAALRLNITAGSGSVALTVLQGGQR